MTNDNYSGLTQAWIAEYLSRVQRELSPVQWDRVAVRLGSEYAKLFRKGALIKWNPKIGVQRLAKMHDPGEPDLNVWQALEEDCLINRTESKVYLYIDGWSIPFSLKNLYGFEVKLATELGETLYAGDDEREKPTSQRRLYAFGDDRPRRNGKT